MTRTGKCDTCRLRKVKCDEQKPKCSACQKRDRVCTYSYGKVSALVVEDPNQLSKHGKARVAPLVYPLIQHGISSASSSSPSPPSSHLRLTAERDADDGQGVFNTLTPVSKDRPNRVRKPTAQQRRKLVAYLTRLKSDTAVLPFRFSSPTDALATRYLNILGHQRIEHQPLAILGTWVSSIPSRIGHNPVVDLAVEYLADSFAVYRDNTFSKQCIARQSKAKALKELQLAIGGDRAHATYDTLLAMKMHFAAEVFMGIQNLYHTIHAAALQEILKSGTVSGLDEEHYWSFIDSTYIDDVVEAMIAGRTSVYDNEFYLSMTYPPSLSADASVAFRAQVVIMHCFIQLPRLVCLVRHAIDHPENAEFLGATVALAETLWDLDPRSAVQEVLDTCTTLVSKPAHPEIADIVTGSYHFDSIQTCILISRYWMLQIDLCGLIQSLHEKFPAESADSSLPDLATIQEQDLNAAINMARCVRYGIEICPELPLVPLRVHTTLQVSIGSWYRLIQRLSAGGAPTPSAPAQGNGIDLQKAQRMEDWVMEECNRIHDAWHVHRISKDFLHSAVDDMCGGPIPDWLPIRVRFECEGAEMVMKLEYDVPGPYAEQLFGKYESSWTRSTTTANPYGPRGMHNWAQNGTRKRTGPTGFMTRLPGLSTHVSGSTIDG